jgi:glycosyltransferase involved in cell wall biosynthesis
MAWCYAHCAVFLATTRAEACPNTALEALIHGCSVVSTSADPMPEFLGDAARYYPRGEARTLARVLREALHEPAAARAHRGAQAHRRASQFTWDNTVRGTMRELASAADLTPGAKEVMCAS